MLNVKIALDWLIKNEKNLIKYNNIRPGEEVVNHQLARRIRKTNINTDVEYGVDQTTGSLNGTNEIGKAIRPDIIVHKRGENSTNMIAIECKWRKNINYKSVEWDVFKLVYLFTSQSYHFIDIYFVVYKDQSTDESSIHNISGTFKEMFDKIEKKLRISHNESLIFKLNPLENFTSFISSVSGLKIKNINISKTEMPNIIMINNVFMNTTDGTFTNSMPKLFTLDLITESQI